ncbi:MAG: MBL fold metallo-hydrolase [Candidatus Magasanikbacteria bacterium]|nr:MBL fold metallo-hydrolase [Candidatus Magasanikbacteria bacterium]
MGEPDNYRAKIVLSIAALVLIVSIVLLFLKFSSGPDFKIVFLNVGQGDSALIRFPGGAKMLVDCGPNREVLNKLGEYLPFYDRTIDYLVITHPDTDHYGGCSDVLKRYEVKKIITNGNEKDGDPYWQVWKKYLALEGAEESVVTANYELNDSGAIIKFFSPTSETARTSDNNSSLAFRLTYGTTTVFFTGDIEERAENDILSRYCATTTIVASCDLLESQYLKVAHHGSDSSSGEDFLKAVSPQYAIISVGKNRFGHPSLRVTRKLERVGAEVWRTDEKNDIIIR